MKTHLYQAIFYLKSGSTLSIPIETTDLLTNEEIKEAAYMMAKGMSSGAQEPHPFGVSVNADSIEAVVLTLDEEK